jgi:hypothetical protein
MQFLTIIRITSLVQVTENRKAVSFKLDSFFKL